ncbi:hypothetical protein Tco_1274191 [Tanacetum coccineum]
MTPVTTPSSTLLNLPNFGSLFGFDNRLKALEDNFSEFKQTNQYAEALSSIPSIVDQYLANKMKEVVDVAVQLKSDRIREEAQAENQQFLDSIDEGMKKVIKEQVKSEVSQRIKLHKLRSLLNDTTWSLRFCGPIWYKFVHADMNPFQTLKSTKAITEKLDMGSSRRPAQYPHDLRDPALPLVPNSAGSIMSYRFITSSITTLSTYVVVSQAASTLLQLEKTPRLQFTGHFEVDREDLVQSMWSLVVVNYNKFASLANLTIRARKAKTFLAFATLRESARDVLLKKKLELLLVNKVEIVKSAKLQAS